MRTLADERDAAQVLSRLRALRPDSTRRWGRMSAHQVVCHLSDGYRVLIGQRPTQLVSTPLPRPIMRWIALYAPVRWPADIPTTPDLDQDRGGTRPADFLVDVAELELLLRKITIDERGRLAGRLHPIFGRMSESAWLRWAYLHADHHLRQFGL